MAAHKETQMSLQSTFIRVVSSSETFNNAGSQKHLMKCDHSPHTF